MTKPLKGKVALITGSGGLIGPAIVKRLANDGATIAVTDMSLEVAEGLAKEVNNNGGKARAYMLDVTNSKQIAESFKKIKEDLGPVNILVNNAGKLKIGTPFQEMKEEDWTTVLDVNLAGIMRCCQYGIPEMIKQKDGRIINLSSIAGVSGLPGWADYAASKGAVISFSQTLAMELGQYNITVNCVSPGMICGQTSTKKDGTWLGRSGTPEDIASMVAYLASPEGSYITGCNYLVDGGRVIGPKGATWGK